MDGQYHQADQAPEEAGASRFPLGFGVEDLVFRANVAPSWKLETSLHLRKLGEILMACCIKYP